MRIFVDVPEYYATRGVVLDWDPGYEVSMHVRGNEVTLQANQAGLRSLARHFLTLALDDVPVHAHVHLDSSNSLEDGSGQLIIERT